MRTWPALEAGELELPDNSDLLWRQMTKSIWDEEFEQPGQLACGPQAADVRKPSFSQEVQLSAQDSRDWHQQNAKTASFGVWCISVGEVVAATLRAIDDSGAAIQPGELRAPGHAFVDYRTLSKNEMKDARGNLLRHMIRRGEQATTDIGFVGDTV